MAEKPTIMKLKVDLQCHKCYNKVKKLLCKFPQIQDQVYDEKQNFVIIKVVCCNPEKIRDKLCCKGGGSIKSIEIVEPPKPEPPKPKPPKPEKPKLEPPKPKPAEPEKTKPLPRPPPDEPPMQDAAPPPPPPQPTVKFREPTFVPVVAYPPPIAPVVQFYNDYYGRLIYDSYGGGGRPCYMSHYDESLSGENISGCIII